MLNNDLLKRKQQLEKELHAIQLEEEKHEAYAQVDIWVKYILDGNYKKAAILFKQEYEKNEKYQRDMQLKKERAERLKAAREKKKNSAENSTENVTENYTENYEEQPQYNAE